MTMTSTHASPFAGLDSIVQERFPLQRYTWYRIGGPARYFVQPTSVDELRQAFARCLDHRIQTFVLGLGANLLVLDEGVDGAVFRLDHAAFKTVEREGNFLTVGAGVDLQKLIVRTVREGLAGIETLAGIPGTIGGVVRMNAGGKFGDIAGVVHQVQVMHDDGMIEWIDAGEINFGYRRSQIEAPFIIAARLRFELDDPDELARRMRDVWMYKKQTQPLNGRSCGCIFKNPAGQSAGALIDRAGLKGHRVGLAEVSPVHANFLLAHPDCPSGDVLLLIRQVRQRVMDQFGVDLHPEVRIWPETTFA
jgi:UDP-N-acetylmuramate dehydrogenase